jgi:aminoglycoside N3'-acetyltransferase
VVPGADDPQSEIWCLAHAAEPGAADNASGVAVCLEAARILEDLIASGKMRRPRRSIRFLNGFECYAFFHYLEHQPRFDRPLAGICVDTVGLQPRHCGGRLYWHSTIPMSAQFVNDIGRTLYSRLFTGGRATYRVRSAPFVATSDTLIGDPVYGFPCPWLTNCWRRYGTPYSVYHSSGDLPNLLSRPALAALAAGTAGYLAVLADLDTDSVIQLAKAETGRLTAMLRRGVEAPAEALLRAQHEQSLLQLERWFWGGTREAGIAALADCRRRFEACRAKGRSRGSRSGNAGAVPYRTAPLTPDPNNLLPPLAQRVRSGRLRPWALYWADGKRNCAEIARLLSGEYGATVPVEEVADYFETMAATGYARLVPAAALVSSAQLVRDLRRLGLRRGMDVMVHASLAAVGHVAGGPATVVDALLSVIGARGNLLMPSFNHREAALFNPAATRTVSGVIAETMWRRPDCVRSEHPTHAVAAIGPQAADWCADHVARGIWGANSPIGALLAADGYILSLGVDHECRTVYHLAEIDLAAPCMDSFGVTDRVLTADGSVAEVPGLAFRATLCPQPSAALGSMLDAAGRQQHGNVGNARSTLAKARDIWLMRRRQLADACPRCRVRPHPGR